MHCWFDLLRSPIKGEYGEVTVTHKPIFSQLLYRWIQHHAPPLEKLIGWYRGHTGCSWRVDETYIRCAVNGCIRFEPSTAAGVQSISIYRGLTTARRWTEVD